jgi:hypothetical protein
MLYSLLFTLKANIGLEILVPFSLINKASKS